MDKWAPADWAIFLAALAAAISSVITAIQNKGLAKKADTNHAETMNTLTGETPKETP